MSCEFKLYKGIPCGQPIKGPDKRFCWFHNHIKADGEWTGGGLPAIELYIEQNSHPFIDFSGLRFKDHPFIGNKHFGGKSIDI